MNTFRFVKPALVGVFLALSSTTAPAFAEDVDVMIVNTRGEDGIYRPALRVLRGSTVSYIAAGTQGLTEAILRDLSQLGTWLGANVPSADPDQPISFTITEIRADPPVAEEEPEDGSKGPKDCVEAWNSGAATCTPEEAKTYCDSKFPAAPSLPGREPTTPEYFCRS